MGATNNIRQSTGVSSVTEREMFLKRLEHTCNAYWNLRENFKHFAPPTLYEYLRDYDFQLPLPPDERNHQQRIDSANVNAVLVPWGGLYINQYIDFVEARALLGMTNEQIFAQFPSAYEMWRIDKEYKDIKAARNTLRVSVAKMEANSRQPVRIRDASAKQRARRLLSGGYGSSLREVISANEDWPEEGWANNLIRQPFAPYEARFRAKMRNRPFILDNDPTDCSGIASQQALKKLEGR